MAVVIPALDEAGSIAEVISAIPRPPVAEVVVVDNASEDGTAEIARRAGGATVVRETRKGYGAACQTGIRALPSEVSVVVFLDGDGSDDPRRIPELIRPIQRDEADLVVGSRRPVEPGALPFLQRIGNRIAAGWLRRRYKLPATDLGPFRAIRRDALEKLGMSDPDYGWTVEMQIRAARRGLRYREIPVPYRRRRQGASKISGTPAGVLAASCKILGLLLFHDPFRSNSH